jgi:transketolase
VNAIRVLAMDAVQKANSGHPGAPLGMADLAFVLWSRFLRFDPERPDWPDRDRFVLSAGHASMLQYALLHLFGYDLPLSQIQEFRQWGSRTPGHPEHDTSGVEITTGPLGQGLATAVGMAIAERSLAARLPGPEFNIVDHHTYVIASDGDMMEGVQSEAASLAGHLRLGKLVVLYDDNGITIDGSTDLSFATEDVAARYEAYGWHAQRVDGHDRPALEAAITAAVAEGGRPSLVAARTHIAYGAPGKQDTSASHGSPLGEEEIRLTKEAYGWPSLDPFFVPDEVRDRFRELGRRHQPTRRAWDKRFSEWGEAHPEGADLWQDLHHPSPPDPAGRPTFDPAKKVATRAASGKTLSWLVPRVPALLGGSADLTPSNLTMTGEEGVFAAENPAGRYLHFGIREHAMAAAMNGMALHGGVLPFGGTFLIFSDYLRPALRLSALMGTRVIYVFTHDSIFLGEDGPTHQPIAALPALRAIPHLTVIRPSDPEETVRAWELALERRGPVALSLTRQGLPVLDREGLGCKAGLERGAYVLLEVEDPRLIAFATGSEVHLTLEAARQVNGEGGRVRVVAVPSWEIFEEQEAAYREEVLAPDVTNRMAVEAASPFGWERFVGMAGEVVGMTGFGASAPAGVLAEKFGFTVPAVAAVMKRRLAGG